MKGKVYFDQNSPNRPRKIVLHRLRMILGALYVVTMAIAATLAIVAAEDTVTDKIPTECPKIDPIDHTVHLAHESDCTKFYKCNHGQKVEMICPIMNAKGDRLYFNPKLQVCDYPDNVNCTSTTKDPPKPTPTEPTPSKPTSSEPTPSKPTPSEPTPSKPTPSEPTPSEPTPSQPSCSPDGIGQSHECSCENYYLCKNGDLVLRKCPDGLHWNTKAGKCDKPNNAKCIQEKASKWYY